MYKIKKLLTLPIISLSNGEQLGKVQDVILNPKQLTVAALVLDYRKGIFKEPRFIPFEKIKSIGEHAVTIEEAKDCERAGNLPELVPLLKRPAQLMDVKVITQDGTILGSVEEYSIDETSGKIISLEIAGNFLNDLFHGRAFLEGNVISTIGRSAVIVQAEAQSLLRREDSSISGTAKSVKETGHKVWSSTMETTKKLGESLYKSVEKFTSDEEEKQEAPKAAQPQTPDKKIPAGVQQYPEIKNIKSDEPEKPEQAG